jgi:hypothetical protein
MLHHHVIPDLIRDLIAFAAVEQNKRDSNFRWNDGKRVGD